MEKNRFSSIHPFASVTVLCLMLSFFGTAKAQMLAQWPLIKAKTGSPFAPTNVAVGVNASLVVPNDSFNITFVTLVPSAIGLRLKQTHNWPSYPNPSDLHYSIDFPITPATGYDLNITGLTLYDSIQIASGDGYNLAIAPYYQIDSAGMWIPLAAPQSFPLTASSTVNFGNINLPFYLNSSTKNGHTYKVRLCIYSPNGAVKADYFNLSSVIFYGSTQLVTIVPTVTTGTPTVNGKYAAVGTGSYSFGSSYQKPIIAGVTWGSASNPSIATSPYTADGANGVINSNITGLSAGITYHLRAFAITLIDTIYGQDFSFTTAAATPPAITTVAATNILSVKATVGGNITDSGGMAILQRGVCWSTTSGAETATSGTDFTNDGTGSTAFSSIITSLQPSITYYVKAYAKNSLGISYGNEISFTTIGAVPVLSAVPSNVNFGGIVFIAPAPVLSFRITGANLSPATGIVTLTPPSGFYISTSATSGFVTAPATLSVPYSNGALGKVIYVQLPTQSYGVFAGNLLLSGGGTTTPNIDTVVLSGSIVQDPTVFSNVGTDFWAGFGLEENMKIATTQFDTATATASGAHLSLYIGAGNQPANVVVELPGLPEAATFPRMITIPANSVTEVGGFPVGDGTTTNFSGAPDTRLYYTGVSNRGIHVYSSDGAPITCWLYDWATNTSAAGALLLPTNTWSSSYTVQAYGGTTSNTGFPSSYFFAIAKDDNTMLTITPTADIIDSASSPIITKIAGGTILHPKGVTYNVLLAHKGDVYNAVGIVDATTLVGADLTGTKVATTSDKLIAVFGGNARTLINTSACGGNISGSDNLIQQMFPAKTWGTRYLTTPTKNMEFNTFRVSVKDLSTTVKVNGSMILSSPYPVMGATWDSTRLFYEFASNQPMFITGDKPILVSQFIMPGNACGGARVGNVGTGDPEMILLSPTQEAINSATVFCPGFKSGKVGGGYINVVIPSAGVSSFMIDGKTATSIVDTGSSSYINAYGVSNCTLGDAFVVHKGDSSYRYATFHVSYPALHTFSSDVPFNAIAYGTSSGESWGYNAGMALRDLSAIIDTIGNLPVAITTIKATSKSGSVVVKWSTATELNTSKFIIQHSTNGTSFTDIGNIKATGNRANSYQFIDGNPVVGTNYYRLQSVDKDGASTYSIVISVQLAVNSNQLVVYPNPSRDKFTINGSHIALVRVVDNMGRVVKVVSLKDATNPILSVSGLQAGIYHLRVQTTDGNMGGVGFVKE